jgi:plastocyanin
VVACVALVGAVGLAGATGARGFGVHPDQASDALTVTVGTALAFTTSTDEITPGDTVTVTIVQTSTTQHTFTLLNATDFQFNWTPSSADSLPHIFGFLAAHPPLVNVSINPTPGTQSATFVAPPYGLYEYLCLISGHFAGGMWGILGSGEHGSGGGTADTGPGAPVFIISGTIAGLVVLALVLGFVIGRRKGAVHEMPPERLGYPEPAPPAPKHP